MNTKEEARITKSHVTLLATTTNSYQHWVRVLFPYILTNAILSDLIILNHLIKKKCCCFIFIWLLVRWSIILHIFGRSTPSSIYCLIISFFSIGLFNIFLICMLWIEILCYTHCKYLLPECVLSFKFIIFYYILLCWNFKFWWNQIT